MFELEERFRVDGVTVIRQSERQHIPTEILLPTQARRIIPLDPPVIGIVGSIHGNEPCGLHVIEAMREPGNPIRKRITHGTLVLIHGNPAATQEGYRHTRGGTDLNRLFDFEFMERLPYTAWKPEHHRAAQLRPILESLDAVLDLHSSTEPSPPFVITPPGQLNIAEKLGCPFVTWGWDGPGLLANRVLASPLIKRGKIGQSVECGQHRSTESTQLAFDATERFLFAMGILEGPAPESRPCTRLEVVHRICRPTLNFRFHKPFRGFDAVERGALLGEGDGIRLTAAHDYHILLPNNNVGIGEDMLYLAETR